MTLLEHIAYQADSSLAPEGYRLGEIIGTGGMGVVYVLKTPEGESTGLVVKMVHPSISSHFEAEQQLRHEAEIEQMLKGIPCVVETLAYGRHNKGHGYKIMRHMQGISLKLWLEQNSMKFFATAIIDLQLRLRVILPILRQLIEAVSAIHAHNIVHGDLKPGNILISKDSGQLCLFDFGLAQYSKKAFYFKPDYQAYTPFYSSPSVLAGKLPDIADDVYSLAMIFWEMLFGKESLQNKDIPVNLAVIPALQHFFKKVTANETLSLESWHKLIKAL